MARIAAPRGYEGVSPQSDLGMLTLTLAGVGACVACVEGWACGTCCVWAGVVYWAAAKPGTMSRAAARVRRFMGFLRGKCGRAVVYFSRVRARCRSTRDGPPPDTS